ncbi:MAG: (2Fe-2S) ferredoxin domain-containing protein [Synechococcales cyanobacterium C42_A2020_086]|jgi:(2Fe-2S) ferredoxin|nr:(2Fe-2S) ferredoxin domain-containing protein [Synechococcales cyanobacterium C42_A2020_086]
MTAKQAQQTEQTTVTERCIFVCQHRSCQRQGAAKVLAAFQAAVPIGVLVSDSNCMGQCASGPTVRVMPDGIWYCRIQPPDIEPIVEQHLRGNRTVAALLHPRLHPQWNAATEPATA